MNKEDRKIISFLIGKELKAIKKDQLSIEFPELDFLKSIDVYEKKLEEMQKELK